jgi:hypothetical protein
MQFQRAMNRIATAMSPTVRTNLLISFQNAKKELIKTDITTQDQAQCLLILGQAITALSPQPETETETAKNER